MAHCAICKEKLAELFLGKIKGTVVYKSGSSKQYVVCFSCQKTFKTKEAILEKL